MGSLKGHLRNHLVKTRKKIPGKASIWLFYSLKQNADVPLIGDLEMLHWMSELEIDPRVRSFKLDQEIEISVDQPGDKFEKLKVISVEYSDGSVEFHQIDAGQNAVLDRICLPICYRDAGRIECGQLVIFSAARLKMFSKSSLGFWLKIIAFVSQVRDYDLRTEMGLVGTDVTIYKEGTIGSLLESLPIIDPAIAVGAICRTILQGNIIVESGGGSFGNNTRWKTP